MTAAGSPVGRRRHRCRHRDRPGDRGEVRVRGLAGRRRRPPHRQADGDRGARRAGRRLPASRTSSTSPTPTRSSASSTAAEATVRHGHRGDQQRGDRALRTARRLLPRRDRGRDRDQAHRLAVHGPARDPGACDATARGGDILFMTSLAAATPWPLHLPYAAASAGVEHAVRTLRFELEGTGIRVLNLRCGETIGTDFGDPGAGERSRDGRERALVPHEPPPPHRLHACPSRSPTRSSPR